MLEECFLNLIKGKSKGPGASIARALLRPLSFGYGLGASANNFLFNCRLRKIHQLPRPVISIGNITLGGTGKTPFTAWLAEYFQSKGFAPALISRGYHSQRQPGDTILQNDEARELALRLSDVPHLQGSNRFEIAQILLEKYPQTSVFILDDAFQHRKLARDLDVVLLDALAPFGLNALFPRGLLREPLTNLKRADVILLSRADLIPPDERAQIRKITEHYAKSGFIWGEIAHRFRRVFLPDHRNALPAVIPQGDSVKYPDQILDFEKWKMSCNERRSFAFCGLGNPEGFHQSLIKSDLSPIAFRVFPDHYHYTTQDMKLLIQQAKESGATEFLTTMKDRVKLTPDLLNIFKNQSLAALETGIEFLTDPAPLKSLLNSLMLPKQ